MVKEDALSEKNKKSKWVLKDAISTVGCPQTHQTHRCSSHKWPVSLEENPAKI